MVQIDCKAVLEHGVSTHIFVDSDCPTGNLNRKMDRGETQSLSLYPSSKSIYTLIHPSNFA